MTAEERSVGAVGPATGILEALATAIGSGMVLGGFVAGVVAGWLLSRRGADLDHRVLMSGYVGGVIGLGALVIDWMVR